VSVPLSPDPEWQTTDVVLTLLLLIVSTRRSLLGSRRAKDCIRVCRQDPRNRLRHPQSGSICDPEAALEGWK
jgi:hypothetical protein